MKTPFHAVKLRTFLLQITLLWTTTFCQTWGSQWNVTCPAACSCEIGSQSTGVPLKTALCRGKSLPAVPAVPMTTESLDLTDNRVTSLEGALDDLPDLLTLDLTGNQVTDLSNLTFVTPSRLTHLNLAANELTYIPGEAFRSLYRLEYLNLKGNKIEEFSPSAFSGLAHLRELDLSGNPLPPLTTPLQTTRLLTPLRACSTLLLDSCGLRALPAALCPALPRLQHLSLRRNKLTDMPDIRRCQQLQVLSLDWNGIRSPSVTPPHPRLTTLTLTGNPLPALARRALTGHARLTRLTLDRLAPLRTVDAGALTALPRLQSLHLNDNPRLTYISPAALRGLPELQELLLHNSALQALPAGLLQALPALRDVTLHNNPLRCDCNVHWLVSRLQQNRTTPILNPDKVLCASPRAHRRAHLRDLLTSELRAHCAPHVIPFFDQSYQRELGDVVRFECRAIGVRTPWLSWRLPDGKVLSNGSSNDVRRRLPSPGTLVIRHIKPSDAGVYSCVATNDVSVATATTLLGVHNTRIHVLARGVSSNFITITWNGTDSTVRTSSYLILYRRHGSREQYGRISLQPYMRMYTITGLQPRTTYEFCMTFEHLDKVTKLNCDLITTRRSNYLHKGIQHYPSFAVFMAFIATLMFFAVLCVAAIFVRKYNRRKAYSACADGLSIENCNYEWRQRGGTIPLDTLHSPSGPGAGRGEQGGARSLTPTSQLTPTTPVRMYSSRTSLVGTGVSPRTSLVT